MARIEGVNLPNSKRVEYGLTYIHGIGLTSSRDILKGTGIDPNKRVKDLTDADIMTLQRAITGGYTVEGERRKEVRMDIKRLQEIGSYRGSRHKRGLPARGQRTKTNARTRKGPRRAGTQIALKRMATKK